MEKLTASKFSRKLNLVGVLLFTFIIIAGLCFAGLHLANDLTETPAIPFWPYLLLLLALLIALSFEFINGFHDAANAVATVIYTYSLQPHFAIIWSGLWSFLGVVTSSGMVAFAVVNLLPVELIVQVGHDAGFAMMFSLLTSAIFWNLGTWWLGIPNSSSHTLIGSILGIGIMNHYLSTNAGTSGVNWSEAINVFKALLISPIIGFSMAAILLLLLKVFIKDPRLYTTPQGDNPPPFWIRCLLILTCSGVSFAHGSNDGQKGMGLIMLILIGTVPTVYVLNNAITRDQLGDFKVISQQAAAVMASYVPPQNDMTQEDRIVTQMLNSQKVSQEGIAAMEKMVLSIEDNISTDGAWKPFTGIQKTNIRNKLYLIGSGLSLLVKKQNPPFSPQDLQVITNYQKQLQRATEYIPLWVKIIVAIVLSVGTLCGWKRIVITVGERIGKQPLTYAQGASSELVAMVTILAASSVGLPVSTTHVLSSGVAGSMVANKAGLQWTTIRNILIAWIFTLPAAALVSGSLYRVSLLFI